MTTNYAYDHANRLTSVGGVTYTYDNNGNFLNDGVNSYGYDSANRLTSVGGVTYVYDNNGNVSTSSTQRLLNDGVNAYTGVYPDWRSHAEGIPPIA